MDGFDHVLHCLWRWRGESRDDDGDGEVDEHAYAANSSGADAEQQLVFRAIEELEVDDVADGEGDAADHARDGSLLVDALGEDSHQQGGEEGGGGEAEGEGDCLGNKRGRRVDTEPGCHGERDE